MKYSKIWTKIALIIDFKEEKLVEKMIKYQSHKRSLCLVLTNPFF